MEIGRSFTFPFQDKSWFSKLLIAAVVSIVPIVNFALVGWMVDLAKRVMDHELEELPGWDEFGKKWMGGLYYTVAGFIYALPVILVSCILFAITFGSTFAAAQEGNTDEVIGAIMAGNSVVVICLSCLMAIYGLVLSVLMPALMVHYAKEGSFGAMFKLGTVFGKVRENAGPFFLAWLVTLVFGFLVGFVMSGIVMLVGWIPCIGWIITLLVSLLAAPYTSAVYAHLFGQYGDKAYGVPAPISSAGIPDSLPPAS